MNLQQLRHFVALAEAGSFTRAAERAHLSQPALSRSIAQFEEELGLKLIDRIGKRNEVTAFGQVVLEHARHVLFEADELTRAVALQRGGEGGRLRIGLGSAPSALLATPLLRLAARQRRTLRVTLMRGAVPQQVVALRARSLDMIVAEVRAVPVTPDLELDPLPPLNVGFLARRGHPAARRRRLGFADIARYPVASTLLSEAQERMLVSLYGGAAHPEESLSIQSEDIASLIETVAQSDAVYLGVLAPARPRIEDGSLVELPVLPRPEPSQFAIVRLAGRSAPPAFRLVRELVRERIREGP